MGSNDQRDSQAFTVRLPLHVHDALRNYAFYRGKTMNDLVVRAVRDLLAGIPAEDIKKMSSEAGPKFRASLRRVTKDN